MQTNTHTHTQKERIRERGVKERERHTLYIYIYIRDVNLCVNRKPYGFLRFARAYGRTMQSLRIFMIFADSNFPRFIFELLSVCSDTSYCFVSTKVNDLSHNKLCFVCLLYMGMLQLDPIPKLCFVKGVDNL